jgi:hypothetical protein
MGILRCIRGVGDPNSRITPCIQRVFESGGSVATLESV